MTYDSWLFYTYTERSRDVLAAMVTERDRRLFILDLTQRQGYNMRHAKEMATRLFPTPAQARMRKARKAKKGGKKSE